MSNELDIIGVIIQAGGTGIALVLIWLIRYLVKEFNATIRNHLEHSNEAMKAVTKTNILIAERKQSLSDSMNANQRELINVANNAINSQNNKFARLGRKLK